jgi:hypothetical protein
MFLAMTACLPVAYYLEHRQHKAAQDQQQSKADEHSGDAEQPLLEPQQVGCYMCCAADASSWVTAQ